MSTQSERAQTVDNLQLKTQLLRLQSEIRQRIDSSEGPSVDFLRSSVNQIVKIKGKNFADIRYGCLAKCVPSLYAAGQFEVGLLACEAMVAIGRRSERPDWLRLAKTFAGIIEGERGNLTEAVVHYQDALAFASQLHDAVSEAYVITNLGVLFQYAGLYRDAIPCYRKALAVIPATDGAPFMSSTYTNLAQTYLAMGDLDNAQEAICRALELSREPATSYAAHSRTIREWTFVDIALERGDTRLALRHADASHKYALLAGTSASMFLVKLARGLLGVHTGSADEGLTMLENALSEAEQHGEAKRIDAIVALLKAYEISGRPDSALRCLNELMRHLVQKRKEQLAALLRLDGGRANMRVDDYMDLHAWKYREARLRAATAEHEVINARQEMLERLAIAANLKEDVSGEHGYRVGKLSALIAQELNWSRDNCHLIEIAARLHDIGKVGIPDRILLGSQELKDAERHFMRSHTVMGAELLAKSDVSQLKMAEEIARWHHEWWDGSGYPSGIAGERIPIHARITALADVFDALTHGRPYAEAWPAERALSEIRELSGSQFDPELSGVFIRVVCRLLERHHDLDSFLGRAAQESAFLTARKRLKSVLSEEKQKMAEDRAA